MILHLNKLAAAEAQSYLQHAIAPRPVCFASTIDKSGQVNLSPFSFFNLFSSNPPVLIFSPARRVRDNSIKHTLENVMEVKEVVVNIVDYDMVQQVSLSSCDFSKETNEFTKSGLTAEPATMVQPPMVKESKIKLECKVLDVQALGTEGGAGNLVICEVLVMHIDDSILDDQQKIDQQKIQHIARLGGDWYCKVDSSNLFKVAKPNAHTGIGIDRLPENIRTSTILTGNHLGQLGNVAEVPVINPAFDDENVAKIIHYYSLNPADMEMEFHRYAAQLLNDGKVEAAWQVLLIS